MSGEVTLALLWIVRYHDDLPEPRSYGPFTSQEQAEEFLRAVESATEATENLGFFGEIERIKGVSWREAMDEFNEWR